MRPKSKDPLIRILISLPLTVKQHLDDIRRLEGYTVSGYIRHLITTTRDSMVDAGWSAKEGWAQKLRWDAELKRDEARRIAAELREVQQRERTLHSAAKRESAQARTAKRARR